MLKLNEVSEIIMGQSPSSATYNTAGEGLPFFQGNADFGDEHPNVRMFCSIPIKIAEVNDVLLSVRAPIGAVNVADKKCCIGRGLAAIRPQKGKSITRYLFHLLIANRGSLENKGTGSTFKAITGKVLNSVKVPHENVDEQKAIADILDKIVATIRKRRVQVSLCDDLVKSQFIEMFGDPVENEKSWDVVKLSEIAEFFNGLTYRPEDVGAGTIVLRSSNIQDGELDFSDIVRVRTNIRERLFVRTGDLLMCSRNGSAKLVGKVAPIGALNEPMTFGAFMMIIRSSMPEYLMTYFRTEAFREQIKTGATTTINQITATMLNKVRLPLPPTQLVNQYALFVKQTDKSKIPCEMEVAA